MTEQHHKASILVVEDDVDNLHLLEVFFGSSGYENVHGTTDGRKIAELVTEIEPDLVLLDLHMPHVNGLDLILNIREVPAGKEVPIIVASGDVTPESRRAAEKLNVSVFLTKPYEMTVLLQSVEQALDGKNRPSR